MASNEDCEALEILLCERTEAIATELEKEMKMEKQDQIMIKEEKNLTVHATELHVVLLKQQQKNK